MPARNHDQLVVALLFVGRYLLDEAAAAITQDGVSAVSAADTAFLLAVRAFPSSSQKEIATVLGRDKTTLSRTVTRLEEMGYVDVRIDPVDGRRRTLALTDAAVSAARPALEALTRRLRNAASQLTPEEEAACFRLIDLLVKDVSVA